MEKEKSESTEGIEIPNQICIFALGEEKKKKFQLQNRN